MHPWESVTNSSKEICPTVSLTNAHEPSKQKVEIEGHLQGDQATIS